MYENMTIPGNNHIGIIFINVTHGVNLYLTSELRLDM